MDSGPSTSPSTSKVLPRKASVSLVQDDYSISDEYWNLYKSNKGTRRRSLTRSKSVSFDYDLPGHGMTPLMKSVEKKYVKKTLNLLLFGANPNIQQNMTGDTALHLAVDICDITLVKLLITFNADPTICNRYYQNPLDVAENIKQQTQTPSIKTALKFAAFSFVSLDREPPKRDIKPEALSGDIDAIIEVLTTATRLQLKTFDYFESHSVPPSPRNGTDKYLLCLDGGGVRVFNVIQAMINIENRITQLTSEKHKFYNFFDYVGGTSSGGMAACILVYNDTDTLNGRALTLKGMMQVLTAPVSIRGEKMDTMLKDIFGEDRTMSNLELGKPQLIVTSTLAEYTPYDLHLMTSYGEPRDGQAGPRERKVWEAARITTSAPGYFPVLRDLKLLDGGLVCNNPTLDCMAEIIEHNKKEGTPIKIGCVVSIGTGFAPKEESQEVEFFTTSALSYLSAKNIHALQGLIKHFVNQATLSDGREVVKAHAFCEAIGSQYYRLTPPMKEEIELGQIEEIPIINMLYNTQLYYWDNPQLIDDVAKCLISK